MATAQTESPTPPNAPPTPAAPTMVGKDERTRSVRPRGFWRRIELFLRTRIAEKLLFRRQIEKFYLIMGGHIYFQTLAAAVELKLFTTLNERGRLTEGEVADALGIDPKPARILLLGCTALGLLRKQGMRYSNTRLTASLLDGTQPGSVVPIVRWQHHINYRPMFRFHDALRANANVGLNLFEGNEPTLYERLAHEPNLEAIFQDAMQAISVQANHTLARFVDFSPVTHLVDVGGGDGSNLITLVREYPHLQGTIFDSPSVSEIAEQNVAEHGLSERVDTVAGNCFDDRLPNGDCFLLCHFCTIWSEERNRALFRKIYEALPQGGRIVIFNMMQSNSRTGPLSAALGSPYFLTLATGEGMLYTWSEYESWLKSAGFVHVTHNTLPRDHGVIVGFK